MKRIARWWWLVVVLAALFGTRASVPAHAEDPCVLCADAKSIACPTCGGKATTPNPCDACGGDGRGRCGDRPRTGGKFIDDRLESVGLHTGTSRRCPNPLCERGTVETAKSACKPCGASGKVKCLVCSDACAVCEGKKTRDGACPDCNGAGKLSCLLCAPPAASCAACAGKATAACAACKGAGHVLDVCAECAGRGQLPCGFCVGTAKAACEACFGSGKDVVAGMSKSGPAPDCAACKAKGVKTCPICQKGWTACKPCSGTKRSDGPCARCSGGKTVACRSCGDAVVRTLELEGLKAGKEGRKDAGIVLLERAAKAAAEQSERAADAVIAADQAATEKIKEMDRGGGDIRSRFDRTGAARRAVLASLAAAARAESCRAAEKRIQGELAAAETAAPALPSGGK